MSNQQDCDTESTGPQELLKPMAEIAARSQRLISEALTSQVQHDPVMMASLHGIADAFTKVTAKLAADPEKLAAAQKNLWRGHMDLWRWSVERLQGNKDVKPAAVADKDDKRFNDDSWNEIAAFDFIKQSYLLTSRWITSTVQGVDGLDAKTAHKAEFYTRMFTDAMAPGNYIMTNPKVLRTTVENGGKNLIDGLENLSRDMARGNGALKIKTTDEDAFEIGVNIANTPGKVIFRNDLMELIQYAPSTDKVHRRPLLLVTPWINKYYILDLSEKNSFIKWIVDQGHTVFVTSWVNPDEKLAAKTFEDYMREGPLAALAAIEQATGEKDVDAVGYCIGGTLLSATLAWMAAKNDKRIKSATFLTTMVDFAEPGDLGVFIDDELVDSLDEKMAEQGYLDGSEMANVFSMMRANDLIWSFIINNYLLGKAPMPFDLLYWNADSTRMPAAMHSFYLRKMYLENKLAQANAITLGGVAIDLGKIKTPAYILATREDHIAPWKSTYAATRLYSGPIKFVLAASGHIAGVVNPPSKNKYCHWTNAQKHQDPENWMQGAKIHQGSWWPDWGKWIKKHNRAEQVAARLPGDGKLKAIEDAPGSYVKVRLD